MAMTEYNSKQKHMRCMLMETPMLPIQVPSEKEITCRDWDLCLSWLEYRIAEVYMNTAVLLEYTKEQQEH